MFSSSAVCGLHSNSVTAVKFSRSGDLVASASADRTCFINTVKSEISSVALSGHADGLNDVIWLHSAQHVATASDDNTIKLWDIEKQEECAILAGHDNAVFCLDLHPQHNIIVSGSYDESIKLWDARCSKTCVYSIEAHADPVSSVHFSGTGNTFVSSSYDSMVRMWDLRYGQCLRTVVEPSQQHPICSARFMPNEDYLVMSQLNSMHYLVDLRADIPQHLIRNSKRDNNAEFCKIIRQYSGHKNVTHSIFVNQFEYNGAKYLITGSEDNKACIWNMDTEELVCHISGINEGGAIIALDVHQNSRIIAVGGFGTDYSVRIMHLHH